MTADPAWQEMAATGSLAGDPVHLLEETGSTSDVAMELAGEGAPTWTVVVAESQSRGRGRLGRQWSSPRGCGLYFSVILRPDLVPGDLPKVTLAAGLAVCRALEEQTGLAPMIKWPNDIILDDRKLGGILAETLDPLNSDGRRAVILGVGLNVNTAGEQFPEELRDRAVSLALACGRDIPRGSLLAAIIAELKEVVARLENNGFAAILASWRRRDATVGRMLTWVTMKGEAVRGVSLGPDETGQLLVRDAAGKVHEVLSGDISLAGQGPPG